MMKLSIYLPASLDEIEHFAATCRSLGLPGDYLPVIAGDEMEGFEMIGDIGTDDTPQATPPVEPPAPAAKAPKVAKRAADRAPAKKAKPLAKRPSGPDARTAALAYLEANGGSFPGGAAALAREIGHGEQATTKVVQRLAAEGLVIVDKASKTSTRSISLASARPTPGNVTKLPDPGDYPKRIIRDAQTPATPPVGGLTAPAGGWA